jgi:hypothetical protein
MPAFSSLRRFFSEYQRYWIQEKATSPGNGLAAAAINLQKSA